MVISFTVFEMQRYIRYDTIRYDTTLCIGCAKTGLFLRSDNFATTNDRKASKVSEFCLELNV